MARPTFRRFWVRILPDGSALPQFDPYTGKYCGFESYSGQVAQIVFMGITPQLAEKIRANGDLAEPTQLPNLTFEVPPGTKADLYRTGTLQLMPMRVCGFCSAEFAPGLDTCPRCLARNHWYCEACDKLVENPIIDYENQQVRCPVCEKTVPCGLRGIRRIEHFVDEKLFTHYVLTIGEERHIILDYRLTGGR